MPVAEKENSEMQAMKEATNVPGMKENVAMGLGSTDAAAAKRATRS